MAPTGIEITGADTVEQFGTIQLTADLTPANATGTVKWGASDNVTVSQKGVVTGVTKGTATVTAYIEGNEDISTTKTIQERYMRN